MNNNAKKKNNIILCTVITKHTQRGKLLKMKNKRKHNKDHPEDLQLPE